MCERARERRKRERDNHQLVPVASGSQYAEIHIPEIDEAIEQ